MVRWDSRGRAESARSDREGAEAGQPAWEYPSERKFLTSRSDVVFLVAVILFAAQVGLALKLLPPGPLAAQHDVLSSRGLTLPQAIGAVPPSLFGGPSSEESTTAANLPAVTPSEAVNDPLGLDSLGSVIGPNAVAKSVRHLAASISAVHGNGGGGVLAGGSGDDSPGGGNGGGDDNNGGGDDNNGGGPGPSPSPGSTPTPDHTPTPSPTSEPSPTPEPTPSSEPSPTPDPTPTWEPSPTPTPEPSPTPTPEPSPTLPDDPTPSPSPSETDVPLPCPTETPLPDPLPTPCEVAVP
jgi:hypothetical protein